MNVQRMSDERASERSSALGAKTARGHEPAAESGSYGDIVGSSVGLANVLLQVRTVAPTDSTVLISGETGTGKELIARAIHELGGRGDGPFERVNCGAIPAGLLESELMGHERGAFTGAVVQRIGRFEMARNGTLFLDEIGELPLELQPKLLRLLQEKEFERVGGSRTVRSNARIVAATNRDLWEMVRERGFREDLYYRLDVFPIVLPPLRDRRQDIVPLAEHFLRVVTRKHNKDVCALSGASRARLLAHSWPGNIRELQNVVERAVILSSGPILDLPDFRPSRGLERSSDDLAAVSRAHILRVLEDTGWVVGGRGGAAERLGLHRSTLLFRMRKLGIERPARGLRLQETAEDDPSTDPSGRASSVMLTSRRS